MIENTRFRFWHGPCNDEAEDLGLNGDEAGALRQFETLTYIALSGQSAREHQMEVLSNNIANLSTPGFKAERMMFQEYLTKPTDGSDPSSYVVSQGNARDMS